MSTNRVQGFLEDIRAHPDDDTPRLVYADWLEEQGDSDRADLIRVQIQRTQLPEWDARQVELLLRERDLLQKHERRWMRELPSFQGVRWEHFRRGFMATAVIKDFTALRDNAPAIWAAAPIEAITIRWPRRGEVLTDIAPIAGLRELLFTTRMVRLDEAERVADAPLLSTLRVLTARDCSLGVEGLRRLAASPHLGSLRALRLPRNSIGNEGIRVLVEEANTVPCLEELDLSETGNYGRYGEDPILEEAGLERLAAEPGLRRMRSLTLSGNAIGRGGLRALLRSPYTTSLKELAVRDNALHGPWMEEFGSAHANLHLDVLDLGENMLGNPAMTSLAEAPCLRDLKELNIDICELDTAGARRLARAPFLGSLRRLRVDYNDFFPKGLQALLAKKPPFLHTLSITGNELGDEGAALLAASPASDTLLVLSLERNHLSDVGGRALARTEHLRSLRVLWLTDNKISKRVRERLQRSPLGQRLASLHL